MKSTRKQKEMLVAVINSCFNTQTSFTLTPKSSCLCFFFFSFLNPSKQDYIFKLNFH